MNWAIRHSIALVSSLLLAASATGLAHAGDAQPSTAHLHVVGGLAELNQFTRHEVPFWTKDLARISNGRYTAEIVASDRTGVSGREMLALVRLGTVPFATFLLNVASPGDAELAAIDLAGAYADSRTLRRSVSAFRPRLQALLLERHDAMLLGVYVYPAQVLYCARPITRLSDLRGLKVRTSSTTQSDWVEALNGIPMTTPFNELAADIRAGNFDCAITGTMSGNTIGLHQLTTHLHTMPISWGLSVLVAHGATWRGLPADLRSLLDRELPRLEAAIWEESIRETEEGIACNVGSPKCAASKRGQMRPIPVSESDDSFRRDILARTVLPRWLDRCGQSCAETWNALLAPIVGVPASRR